MLISFPLESVLNPRIKSRSITFRVCVSRVVAVPPIDKFPPIERLETIVTLSGKETIGVEPSPVPPVTTI